MNKISLIGLGLAKNVFQVHVGEVHRGEEIRLHK